MLLITACIVAILDGLAGVALALALHGRSPVFVFQYIASGLLGTSAFSGGLSAAFIGMLCHLIIAASWTVLFFVVHGPVARRIGNRPARIVIYGVTIWTAMNLVVLPLSQVPRGTPDALQVSAGIMALILAAGWPMVIRFDEYYTKVR